MLEEDIRHLLEQPLLEKGFTLFDVKLYKGSEGLTLGLTLDSDKPLSLDDIILASDIINPLLDEKDLIKESYTLDVSSVGIEKPLDLSHLEKYVDRYVELHLSHPYKGENYLTGTIKEVKDDELIIEVKVKSKKQKITIPVNTIDRGKITIEF